MCLYVTSLHSLQFDIYCEREPYIYLATSVVFISWAFGAVVLGWLADRYVLYHFKHLQTPATSDPGGYFRPVYRWNYGSVAKV